MSTRNRSPARALGGDLLHQPGFPDARLPADHQQTAGAGRGLVKQAAEFGELGLPADERRALAAGGRRGPVRPVSRFGDDDHRRGDPGGDREVGILAEDGRLELAERRARLQAELVDQQGPETLIRLQRLGLTARPVEGHDQLGPEALAEGIEADQGLQLADQLGVPAPGPAPLRPTGRPPPSAAPRAGPPQRR